jgi:antirestriction protein ArdC
MSTNATQTRDYRQEVTNQIIEMLEAGTAPWQKPWQAVALEMPSNPTTQNLYRGGNAIHLMAVGMARGYDDPRWMTYRQAAENEWQVRKGERGTQIEYWEFPKAEIAKPDENLGRAADSDGDDEAGPRNSPRLIHRVYTVFNAKQIEGIPQHTPKQRPDFEIVDAAESIITNSAARIRHDQNDRAFYDRRSDSIHLPPKEAFMTAGDYYGTALHELAHWSGHPSRLNRQTLNESRGFGDESYAREELRAELASVFMAAQCGVSHDPANHASYVGSWVKTLRDDKNEIFRAAKDAHRMADFLVALEQEKSIDAAIKAVTIPEHRRETSKYVAAFEPGAATVNIEEKATARDQRTIADSAASSSDPLAEPKRITEKVLDNELGPSQPTAEDLKTSFAAARQAVRSILGSGTRTYAAQTDSGVYCGQIVAETDLHIVQRLNSQSSVAHMKHALATIPEIGQQVLITYSHQNARVQAVPQRSRETEIAR